jgi:hypothetical protein
VADLILQIHRKLMLFTLDIGLYLNLIYCSIKVLYKLPLISK